MSDYKHGDWFCRPETEAEAAEIVRLAVASGADNEREYEGDTVVAYGVIGGKVDMLHTKGTEYTLTQLRAMFGTNKWNGEGLPPVGTVCDVFNHNLDSAEWERCTIKYIGPFVVVYESESCVDRSANHAQDSVKFRPLRTKRDKWIEKAVDSIGGKQAIINAEAILGKIYDAGLAKDVEE